MNQMSPKNIYKRTAKHFIIKFPTFHLLQINVLNLNIKNTNLFLRKFSLGFLQLKLWMRSLTVKFRINVLDWKIKTISLTVKISCTFSNWAKPATYVLGVYTKTFMDHVWNVVRKATHFAHFSRDLNSWNSDKVVKRKREITKSISFLTVVRDQCRKRRSKRSQESMC